VAAAVPLVSTMLEGDNFDPQTLHVQLATRSCFSRIYHLARSAAAVAAVQRLFATPPNATGAAQSQDTLVCLVLRKSARGQLPATVASAVTSFGWRLCSNLLEWAVPQVAMTLKTSPQKIGLASLVALLQHLLQAPQPALQVGVQDAQSAVATSATVLAEAWS